MASGLSSTHKAKMLGGTFKLQNLYCQLMLHALQTKKTGYPLGNLGTGVREGARKEYRVSWITLPVLQVKEYDSISRLDQWLTTMLLRIKKTIQGDEEDLR